MESASPTRRSWHSRNDAAWWMPLLRHAWLAPVLLIATWLRFTGLTGEHLYGDEAEYAVVARYLARDPTFLAYPMLQGMGLTPFVSQPPLLLYLMAVSMKLFGTTDFAAILPTALLGVATVGVVYAIGVRLSGRLMGLTAAALLAVLPFHVEMSRRAMLDVGYAFFVMLSLYFLIAWAQTRSRRHAAWAGVAVAAAALSKLPGMLAIPIALIVFAAALAVTLALRARGRATNGDVRETLVQGGIGAIPVVAGGLLYVGFLWFLEAVGNLWVKLQWQLGRVDATGSGASDVSANSRDFLFYFQDPQFSFGELLGGGVFALALVGLAVMAARVATTRESRLAHAVVPIGALVLAAFFLWSDRKEGFYLLPFAPIAAVLVGATASGIRDLVQWAGIRFSRDSVPRIAPIGLAIGLVVVAFPAMGAAQESYEDFALGDTQEKYFGYGTREAAQWIHENDPDAGQYGTLLGRFSLLWYNEQPTYHWYVDHTLIEIHVEQGKMKYVVYDEYLQLEEDKAFMRHLIQKYGGTKVAEYKDGWGRVQVFELHGG